MNIRRYLPLAVLLPVLFAGRGYAADDPRIEQLVARQAQAWEKHDFAIAAGDWLPDAELVSPGGRMTTSQLPAVIKDYFQHFRDVHVTIKRIFTSADQTKVAIEWDWDVTRIRDGVRQVTHDAIIVDLRGGKVASWREYFDLGDSIDAKP